jgi:hypothetical protein
LIDVVGELVEAHVTGREIVLDAVHLARDDSKCPTRLEIQIDNQEGMFGMSERRAIYEKKISVVVHTPRNCDQLIDGQSIEVWIADAIHASTIPPDGLANRRAD